MNRMLKAALAVSLVVMVGCGPKGPKVEELKPKFVGEYCGPDRHKLVLAEDGTYRNQVAVKSPYTGAPIIESCTGAYTFLQEGNEWYISFEPATDKSSIMVSCETKKVMIWSAEGGYVLGDSLPEIPDLMGSIPVKKGECL